MLSSKTRLFAVSLLCLVLGIIMSLLLPLIALFGSKRIAFNMIVAMDECGNAFFGGSPNMTISERTGKAVTEGNTLAKLVAFMIDLVFGKNHCLSKASNPGISVH